MPSAFVASPPDSSLDAQLQSLMQQIRQQPADTRLRVHLAQLCMLLGQWERALGQLQAVALAQAAALPFAQTYREAIRCEHLRIRVFAGELAPPVLGEPRPWLALLGQALTHRARGEHAAADALQAQAFEQAEPTPFLIDSARSEWIADADTRLGPCCEILLDGQYYWLPFEDIESLQLEPPVDLRDLVWLPAQLTLRNGGQHPVLLPVRYPASDACADDSLRRAASTQWQPLGELGWAGLGQRLWASDAGEHPLLDCRHLQRAPQDAASADSGHA